MADVVEVAPPKPPVVNNFHPVFDKLNPCMLEDPVDITMISMLKQIFNAENYSQLEPDAMYAILDSLSKQTRYGRESNIFIAPEHRKKHKSTKILIFKEYYDYVTLNANKVINDANSSLYCINCLSRTHEDNGLFDGVGPVEFNQVKGGLTCSDFKSLDSLDTSVKIYGKGFAETDTFEILIAPSINGMFYVESVAGDVLPPGRVVRTTMKHIKGLLRDWYLKVWAKPMPAISLETKVSPFSLQLINHKFKILDVEEDMVIYDKSKLLCELPAVEKSIRLEMSKVKKEMTIEQQEKAIVEMSGLSLDYETLKERYFSQVSHADLLEMALGKNLYHSSIERMQGDAKAGRFEVSLM